MGLKRVAGAVAAGVADGIVEGIFASDPEYWSGTFPYIGTVDPLPPVDDWLILAGSGVPYLIGRFGKKGKPKLESLEEFGEGMLLYSGPMIIHHTIVNAARMLAGSPKRREAVELKLRARGAPQLRPEQMLPQLR